MIFTDPAIRRSDMIRCALCMSTAESKAPCDTACGRLCPSGLLRDVWFGCEQAAALKLKDTNLCAGCAAPCEQACARMGEVPIRALISRLYTEIRPESETPVPADETRLKTDICGIGLENPFLLSSSVVASTYDMCARV